MSRRLDPENAGPGCTLRALLAASLVLVVATPETGSAAHPHLAAQEAPLARLELAAIPPWIEAAGEVSFDLNIEPVTPDLELVLTIHTAVGSRTAFERSIDGTALGPPLGSATLAVEDLEPGPVGTHRVTVNLGTSTNEGSELSTVPVGAAGVYPVTMQLRVSGTATPTDSLVTHLVVIEEDRPPARLAVGWIWPMSVEAPWNPDGEASADLEEAVAPTGQLTQFTDALAGGAAVPITLAPAPATLDAWAVLAAEPPDATTADAEGTDPATLAAERLTALQDAAAQPSRQVLAGLYSEGDLPTFVAAGLAEEVSAQLARGTDVLRSTLGVRADPRTFLAQRLSPQSLGVLREAGVDRLVVESATLQPLFQNLTLARPFELQSGSRTFLSAAADRELSAILVRETAERAPERPSDAALAQRLLAGLTVVALEAPSEERGVIVAPDRSWRPSADLLVTVMAGLAEHPALRAVTVDAFFSRVEPASGQAASRRLAPVEPNRLRVRPDLIESARARIASLTTMVGDGAPEVSTADRHLLIAASAATTGGPHDPHDHLQAVDDVIRRVTATVRLPDEPSVTLTAQRARIPLSFVNDSARPIRILVRLSSDKLLFPDGDTHEVELPPRSFTAQFSVETRTSGAFPMTVEVTSPDGRITVGELTMTVRSTAVSGVALGITVGAGLFLVGWWGNHIRKTRRRRRAEAPDGAPETPR